MNESFLPGWTIFVCVTKQTFIYVIEVSCIENELDKGQASDMILPCF